MFMKNMTIAGGYLLLVITGPGKWSLDRLFKKKLVIIDLIIKRSSRDLF